jgi:DNA topoisomerase I
MVKVKNVSKEIQTQETEKEIKTEKKNTVLIITEKPAAALKIADALSDGKDKKYSENGVPFYEFERGGKRVIVACAVGHLFGLGSVKEKGKKADIPDFNVVWKPNYENKHAAFTKKYFVLLKKLAKQASEFVVATDYDIEGEVIGFNVIRFIAEQKDAKRMKFSSLTKDELNNAYENLSQTINWGQAIAGETRHYVDWFYGINLSRALMRSLSKAGRFRIMSIGRVQGPSLKIIVDKELQIGSFKPEPYWQVFLQVQDLDNQKIEVKFPRDITNEKELLKFQHLKGKKAQAKTETKDEKIHAPAPFDLTTLQTEAYRTIGTTPSQTLALAQKLYLEGVISYPRTSSQKLPEAIGYEKILKQLGKNFSFVKYAANTKPSEGKKSDPAHPAIYPTGEIRKLDGQEKQLFELIVRRFVACFGEPAIVEERKISVEVNDLVFTARGIQVKEKGWTNVYKYDFNEEKLPVINGEVTIKEIRIEQKMTQPPKRYSAASLLKELEKRNLGTKATRAAIVETLYDRGYIKERSIEATAFGIKLIGTLGKHSPIIIDEKLTRELEKEMDTIVTAKNNLQEKEDKILARTKETIIEITKEMRAKEEEIGKGLAEGNEEMWAQEKEDNTLIECKKCGKGKLRIIYNRNSRRFFIGCSNYPECKTTYSLPPNGLIKVVRDKENNLKICECGFPKLLSIRKAKRPWEFCFNPDCPTNREWVEKREKLKEKYAKEKENGEIAVPAGKVEEIKEKLESKPKKIGKKKTEEQ